jgi:heme/copper-type cytochrome/quinol oxidase subunit 3
MATASQPTSTAVTARSRSGNGAQLGVLLAVAAAVMFVSTLIGAYFSVRNWIGVGSGGFIPDGLKFDNYAGFMTMTSALFAAFAAEWALVSARLRNRRWATAGYGLCVLFFVGAINAVWHIGQRSKLAAADTSYAILFYAVLAAMALCLVAGVIAAIVNMIRVLAGHVWGDDLLLGRAGNWVIHFAALTATVGFFLIYTYK